MAIEMPKAGSVWLNGADGRVGRSVVSVGPKIVYRRVSSGILGSMRLCCSPADWAAWIERVGAHEVCDA